ncbi:hypothetical protein ACLOJK_038492 [Asimina triloba]
MSILNSNYDIFIASEKEKKLLAKAVEESKKTFREEKEARRVNERRMRVVEVLSWEETRKDRIKFSLAKSSASSQGEELTKDTKAILVVDEEGQILEVEDVLSLRVVLLEVARLKRPQAVPKATRSKPGAKNDEASGSRGRNNGREKVATMERLGAVVEETRIVAFKGLKAQSLKKASRAYRNEQARGQVKVVGHEVTPEGHHFVEEKRDQFFIPKVDHAGSLSRVSEKVFKQSYDVEACVLKILKDLLPSDSRVIRENVVLGIELELNTEGRGPAELKLQEQLPHA